MFFSLKKFLIISGVLHLAVLLFFLFSPDLARLLPQRQTKVTWIKLTKGTGEENSPNPYKKAQDMPQSTIREQQVALKEIPKDKKGSDKKSVESPVKKPPPKDIPIPDKRVSPEGAIQFTPKKNPRERTIDDALARMQTQMKQRQIEIEAAQIKEPGGGQSPYGTLDTNTGETNPALVAYYIAIKKKINEQWITTPKQLPEGQSLKTGINVLIDAQGNVTSSSYETKSGDPSFDLSAMRAIERAAPFPPPPDEIKKEVVSEGFLFEFNPRSVVGGAP